MAGKINGQLGPGTGRADIGPDHYLMTKAARLYYEENLTQASIGKRLGLSRQKTQRLLQRALQNGIVHIMIEPMTGGHAELERELTQRYGLHEAVIVETTDYDNQNTVAREVGAAAADFLSRAVKSSERITMSWGDTLLQMVNACFHRPSPRVRDVTVVQGLGALLDPNTDMHAAQLVRRLAAWLAGQAVILPAPGLAGTSLAVRALRGDVYVREALRQAREATLAIMGIGAPRQDSLLVREGDIVKWPELAAVMEQGAVGDLSLRYFDHAGRQVPSALDDRVIGLTLAEIKQIGTVAGMAGGRSKFEAIRGALNGNLLQVLITDHVTAKRVVDSHG